MTWFKLDDRFHSQPKVVAAGNAAIGLYCRLGTYCADLLTDGFVPEAIARSMGTSKELKALTTCPIPDVRPLLSVVDGGYLMRDYLEYNPTREKVLAERAKAKARMDKLRGKAGCSGEQTANERGNLARTSLSPEPEPVPIGTNSQQQAKSVPAELPAAAAIALDYFVAWRKSSDTNIRSHATWEPAVRARELDQHGAVLARLASEGADPEAICQAVWAMDESALITGRHYARKAS